MQKDTLQLIIDNALSAVGLANDGADSINTGAMIVPESFKTIDLEKYMPERRRFRGNFSTTSIEDFCVYANDHDAGSIFVDTDKRRMSARAYFDLGDASNPGHAEHEANLRLEPTPAYAAALAINGERLKQSQLAEFIEDWLPHLTVLINDEEQNPLQAIQAIRNITITASAAASHSEHHFGAQRSAMEEVEAKSGVHQLPTHIKFNLIPHTGFEPIDVLFRVAVITDKEAPRLTLRWVQQDIQQEAIGKNLENMIAIELSNNGCPIYCGNFSA